MLISVCCLAVLYILLFIVVNTLITQRDSTETITPGLVWSSNLGNMTWDDATAACSALGSRLPNNKELMAALKDQFFNWGFNPGGFQQDTFYWSSTKDIIGELYMVAGYNFKGDLVNYSGKKKFEYSVRCVK